MADVNHVVLIGRLTRDAELKYTGTGFPISNFSVAVNRRRKNGDVWEDEANFFDITLYGKSAESLKTYLLKGQRVAVEGELRQDRWQQEDGQTRSKVVISANNLQLLGAPTGGASSFVPGNASSFASGGTPAGGVPGGGYGQAPRGAPSFQPRSYEGGGDFGAPRQGGAPGTGMAPRDEGSEGQPFGHGEDFAEDIPF
jgi:single-strand DNA-binding protein